MRILLNSFRRHNDVRHVGKNLLSECGIDFYVDSLASIFEVKKGARRARWQELCKINHAANVTLPTWELEKNVFCEETERRQSENARERGFLSVRRRYGGNVDCEESRIGFSSPFGFSGHTFLIVARRPYDFKSFREDAYSVLPTHIVNQIKSPTSVTYINFASISNER